MLMASSLQNGNGVPVRCQQPVSSTVECRYDYSSHSQHLESHDLAGSLHFDSIGLEATGGGDYFSAGEIDFYESLIAGEVQDEYFPGGPSDNFFDSYTPHFEAPAGAVVSSGPVSDAHDWSQMDHSYGSHDNSFMDHSRFVPDDWMASQFCSAPSIKSQPHSWCDVEQTRKRQRNDHERERNNKRQVSSAFLEHDNYNNEWSSPTAVTSRPYIPPPTAPPQPPAVRSPALPHFVEDTNRDDRVSNSIAWTASQSQTFGKHLLAVGSAPRETFPRLTQPAPPAVETTQQSEVPASPWRFLLNAMRTGAGTSAFPSATSMLSMALAAFSPGADPGPYGQLMQTLLTQLNSAANAAASNWGAPTTNAQRATMAAFAARFAMAQFVAKQQKEAKEKTGCAETPPGGQTDR